MLKAAIEEDPDFLHRQQGCFEIDTAVQEREMERLEKEMLEQDEMFRQKCELIQEQIEA